MTVPPLPDYGRQLDYFGIEIGAYFAATLPGGPKLVYLNNVSTGRPAVRKPVTGTDNRLTMTWYGDQRGEFDRILFRMAGVDVSDAILIHFFPVESERLLGLAEKEYRGKKASEIRRTYFKVEETENGFQFVVVSQSYIR